MESGASTLDSNPSTKTPTMKVTAAARCFRLPVLTMKPLRVNPKVVLELAGGLVHALGIEPVGGDLEGVSEAEARAASELIAAMRLDERVAEGN